MIRSADTALYEAKRERNRFQYFDEGMQQKAVEKLTMVTNMHLGIAGEQFALHFQPLMDIEERLVGCESLLRWSHPDLGQVSPARFIPLAEETGLILPLGRLGIRAACRLIKRLEQLGNSTARVAVNLSAKQLREEHLVAEIDADLREFQVDPRRIELEITESELMETEAIVTSIAELRSRGVRFAIDDFGTGYSSLSRLRHLPIDTLKIDRSFVAGVPENEHDMDLIRAVTAIGHGLGCTMCAEGVESREQLEFLRDVGCDVFQGYLFSSAVPMEDFLEIVRATPSSPKGLGPE